MAAFVEAVGRFVGFFGGRLLAAAHACGTVSEKSWIDRHPFGQRLHTAVSVFFSFGPLMCPPFPQFCGLQTQYDFNAVSDAGTIAKNKRGDE